MSLLVTLSWLRILRKGWAATFLAATGMLLAPWEEIRTQAVGVKACMMHGFPFCAPFFGHVVSGHSATS
jgi:hypothetical protein